MSYRNRWAFLAAALSAALAGCSLGTDDGSTQNVNYGDYSVFAWNDLGMHCLNPTYDELVILPPYNTLVAQVVQRGSPPQIVTAGLTVEYRVVDNTTSSNKRSYGQFWTYSFELFAYLGLTEDLLPDVGLAGNDLSGTMAPQSGYFTAEGIPVVPVDDSGTWNPYQVAEITVKDAANAILARTRTAIPTSDEINCGKCHGTPTAGTAAFQDILAKHTGADLTSLTPPILCASCHGSPPLGTVGPGSSTKYLSQAIHGFHGDLSNVSPSPACYDCHPGSQTRCSRSTRHAATDGNCQDCHGSLANVASTIENFARVPWAVEPKCVTCHGGVEQVDTGIALYRNALGHGDLRCAACHGSPHAMVPTSDVGSFANWDGYQSQQYQGYTNRIKSMGSCGVCHTSSRGESDLGEFSEVHGGPNPEQANGCYACHTAVPSTITSWPHSFEWRNSN